MMRWLKRLLGRKQETNSEPAVRSFQRAILDEATRKLGRQLTAKETKFVTGRGGFIALEMIWDTVRTGDQTEVERYLNAE